MTRKTVYTKLMKTPKIPREVSLTFRMEFNAIPWRIVVEDAGVYWRVKAIRDGVVLTAESKTQKGALKRLVGMMEKEPWINV